MSIKPRSILFFLLLIVIAWFVWRFSFLISYFLVAAVISLIGRPIVGRLNDIKVKGLQMPSALSSIITIILLYILVFAFVALFIPLVVKQARIISNIEVNDVTLALQEPLNAIDNFLMRFEGVGGIGEVDSREFLQDALSEVPEMISFQAVFSGTLGLLGNAFLAVFSITFITFFFLKDRGMVSDIILTIAPDSYDEKVRNILMSSKRILTRYFMGLIAQLTIFASIVSIGLLILGVDNALLIGFFAGVMNIIPYIGPLIGMVFGVFVGITSNLDLEFYSGILPLIIKVVVVFQLGQLLDNYFFQPLIFSNVVSAHPLEIFVVVLVAGFISGIPGMIVAIPVYTFIRIIAKEFLSEFKVVKRLTENI